jgi:hypothetical protein
LIIFELYKNIEPFGSSADGILIQKYAKNVMDPGYNLEGTLGAIIVVK